MMAKRLMWTLSILEMMMRIETERAIEGPVSKTDIAERLKVGTDYIEQLMHPVRKEGIVTSIRGRNGGFRVLNRKTTLLQVHDAVIGSLTEVDGTEKVNELWETLQDANRGLLNGMTLEDLTDA